MSRLTLETIMQTAGQLADREGMEQLTLKNLAAVLQVKSPSLYNYVTNLEDLKRQLSQYTCQQLTAELLRAGFGKAGFDALYAIAEAYIDFAFEHPGCYESIQWMNVWQEESYSDFQQVIAFAYQLFGDQLSELEVSHIIRGLRSLVHGFAAIVGNHGFGHPSDARESFDYALDIYVEGIKQLLQDKKYREKEEA